MEKITQILFFLFALSFYSLSDSFNASAHIQEFDSLFSDDISTVIPTTDSRPLQLSKISDSLEPSDWWTRRYLIDYGLIVAGTAGYLIGKALPARDRARIGPSYNPDDLLSTFRSETTNKPYLEQDVEETVPEYWIHRLLIGNGLLLIGMEAAEWNEGRSSGLYFHDTIIGYAQSVALTATVTDLTKPFFGRLRPDFSERAKRFHCPDLTDLSFNPYCEEFRDRPLHEDPDEAEDLMDDGRKSFISGHSSHSFNLFGYSSLVIGGRYVWGTNASSRSRRIGIASQALLMSAAVYISESRTRDGRHHLSDIIAGGLTGTFIANISYWTRFNRDGEPRRRPNKHVQRPPRTDYEESFAEVEILPWFTADQRGGGFRVNVIFKRQQLSD